MDILNRYYKFDGKLSLVDLGNSLDLVTDELKSKVNYSTSKAETHLVQLIECIKSIKEDAPLDMSIVESVKQLNILIKKAESDHAQLDKLEVLEDHRNKLTEAHEILTLLSNWDDLIARIRELLNVNSGDAITLAENVANDEIVLVNDSDFINLLPLSTLLANIAQGYKKARKFVSRQILSNIATVYQGYYTLFLSKLAICVEKMIEGISSPLDPQQFRLLYFAEVDEIGGELGFYELPQSLMKMHILKPFKHIFHEYLSSLMFSLSQDPDFSHISSFDNYKKEAFIVKNFVKFLLTYIQERKAVIEGITQSSQINLHIVNTGLAELSILYLMLQMPMSTPRESIEELMTSYFEVIVEICNSLNLSHNNLSPFLPESVFVKYVEIISGEAEKMTLIESNELKNVLPNHSYTILFDSLNKYSFLCIKLCECEIGENHIHFSEFGVKVPKFASNIFRVMLYHSFITSSNIFFGIIRERQFDKCYTIAECIEYLTLLCRIKTHLHKVIDTILTFESSPFEFLSNYYIQGGHFSNKFDRSDYTNVVDSLEDLFEKVPISIIAHSIIPISKTLKDYSTLPVFQNAETNGNSLPTNLLSLAGESFISLIPPFSTVDTFNFPKLVFNGFVQVLIENVKKINKLSRRGAQQLVIDLKYVIQTGNAFELQNNQLEKLLESVEFALTGQSHDDPWLLDLTLDW